MFSRLIQGILLGVSTLVIANEWPSWVSISLNISVVIVSQLTLFFGNIVDDAKTESAVAELPSGKEVTVTVPIDGQNP